MEAMIDEPAIDEVHKTGLEIVVEAPIQDKLHVSNIIMLIDLT